MNPLTLIGELLFGAIDPSKYTSSLYPFDLVNPTSWYSIYLSAISSSSKTSDDAFSKIEMVFDTSVSDIVLPQSLNTTLISLFTGQVGSNATLLVQCSLKNETSTIDFTVGNGIVISIPIAVFVGEATGTDNMCVSPFSFTEDTKYVFGTSFLKYIYLVLNTEGSQGAVAQASFSNSTSDISS